MRADSFFVCLACFAGRVFGAVASLVVTAISRENWPEIFEMVFGVVNIFTLNKVGAANAGWPSLFRFRGSHHQPGVADLARSACE